MKEFFPWAYYTDKIKKRILHPQNAGHFTKEEAIAKNLRLAVGNAGSLQEGNLVRVYILIDPLDAVIVDMRFQAYADNILIGAADAVCEITLRKNILQARRINASLVDKNLQDKEGIETFSSLSHVDLVLSCLENALDQCSDLEVKDPYSSTPVSKTGSQETSGGFIDFQTFPQEEKLAILRLIVKEEVEPYVALDEGGIEVKDLVGNEVVVGYSGACTSCFSATGATLQAVEQILRQKVHPSLSVTPDLSTLKF